MESATLDVMADRRDNGQAYSVSGKQPRHPAFDIVANYVARPIGGARIVASDDLRTSAQPYFANGCIPPITAPICEPSRPAEAGQFNPSANVGNRDQVRSGRPCTMQLIVFSANTFRMAAPTARPADGAEIVAIVIGS